MNEITRLYGSSILKSMLILTVVLVAALFLLSSCDHHLDSQETEDQFWEQNDTYVTEHIDPEGSGFAVMVVKNGKIAFSKGWGMANIESNIPFTPNTPSNLASLSKQFTATAILILYERGKLNLDTKIIEHFPEFPIAWSEITIHHLLTHQSGIPNYTDLLEDGVTGYDGLTNQRAFELVLQEDNLDFTPGKQASYSNSGYLILAMLVERITDKSYADFLKETIFEPLDMDSTFVSDESVVYPQNVALPYDENNELYKYKEYTYGAGGIYSTLHDIYKWDQALYTDKIVSQSTLQLAFTGYTGGDNDYGYGWMVGQHGKYPAYRHGGFMPGFLNYIYRVPGRNFTYLMISNGGVYANDGFGTWTTDLMDKIFAYYL